MRMLSPSSNGIMTLLSPFHLSKDGPSGKAAVAVSWEVTGGYPYLVSISKPKVLTTQHLPIGPQRFRHPPASVVTCESDGR